MHVNVLHLWDRLDVVGGVETVIYNIATGIDRTRFKISAGVFKDGKVREFFESAGIDVFIFDRKCKYDFNIWGKVYNFIKNNNIDIIHTHGHFPGFIGRVIGKLTGKKVISTYHLPLNKDGHPKITKILTKFTLPLADFSTFVSKGVEETFYKNSYSLNDALKLNKKHCTIYNGTDIIKIKDLIINLNRDEERSKIGIKKEDILLLNVGRLTYQKGQIHLIYAVKDLIKEFPNLKLYIFGEGELKEELLNIINKFKLNDYVKIFPPTKEIIKIMYASDIFVLSSVYEGLPMSLIEAMAVGLSVIGTDVCGINEVIVNNYNGILVRPQDTEDLKKAIVFYIENENKRKEMVKNAHESVMKRFSLQNMIQQFEYLYIILLKNDEN